MVDVNLPPTSHIAISDEQGVSSNFGLVIAEALERGKSVITTDGAPAWRDWSSSASSSSRKDENLHSSTSTSTSDFDSRLTYLTGYREGDDITRVQLLKSALVNYYIRYISLGEEGCVIKSVNADFMTASNDMI